MISSEETFTIQELQDSDIVIPYSIVVDGKYKDKVMCAFSEFSIEARKMGGDQVDLIPLRRFIDGDSPADRFLQGSSICNESYVRIGKAKLEKDKEWGTILVYESYFWLLGGEKYKVFNFIGRFYIYRVDSCFPFIHIRKL